MYGDDDITYIIYDNIKAILPKKEVSAIHNLLW